MHEHLKDESSFPEGLVLSEDIQTSLDKLEKQVRELMEKEDRQDAEFRALLAVTEVGDVLKYLTHDPKLNPNVRQHGSKKEEILANGQVLVMLMSLMMTREISFKEALSAGLENWIEGDWRKKEAISDAHDIQGRVACPGVVSDVAYVVSEEFPLTGFYDGILVVKFVRADDFIHLRTNKPVGMVTDDGGIASHPAILARELGIPTIVATGNATKRISHGSRILVDAQGKEGTVTLVIPTG